MKTKKVTFEVHNDYDWNSFKYVRFLRIWVEDTKGNTSGFKEQLHESDAIDVLSTIFDHALLCFHKSYKEEFMKKV